MSASPPAPSTGKPGRTAELDALRGLMLLLMAVTHLPTRFASPLGQPFGFVSAAEGFVLVSAFLAGRVYMARHERDGQDEMRSAFLRRILKIYLWQAVLLAFLFSVVALLGSWRQQPAVNDLLGFYWENPLRAFASGLLLIYNPPLLDILPMYILFMACSPLLLVHGVRQGWVPILAASILLWLLAQFGVGNAVYASLLSHARVPLPPYEQTGSFSLLAWQFLWVLGLWMGATRVATAPDDAVATPRRFPRWMVALAVLIAVTCFVWRHAVGQAPFRGDAALNLLFDKWRLGPLRLLDLFALMVLVLHYAPWLRRRLPPLQPLQTLGRASLQVFVAHLVLALLLLAWLGAADEQRSWLFDAALLAASLGALYVVAVIVDAIERRSAAARRRLRERSTALVKAGAQRSRAAIGRIHPRSGAGDPRGSTRAAAGPVHRP
jgi:hypothetical protein